MIFRSPTRPHAPLRDLARGPEPLAHDQVDQAAGDVDALSELPALDVGPDPGALQREPLGLLLGDVRGDLYAVAQLAVDLDDERDLLGRYAALVPGGPT